MAATDLGLPSAIERVEVALLGREVCDHEKRTMREENVWLPCSGCCSELAARAAREDVDSLVLQAKIDALREARKVITQYLSTAEKWRYDRVMWAFAIMLGEIPEGTPEPMSPSDEAEAVRAATRTAGK